MPARVASHTSFNVRSPEWTAATSFPLETPLQLHIRVLSGSSETLGAPASFAEGKRSSDRFSGTSHHGQRPGVLPRKSVHLRERFPPPAVLVARSTSCICPWTAQHRSPTRRLHGSGPFPPSPPAPLPLPSAWWRAWTRCRWLWALRRSTARRGPRPTPRQAPPTRKRGPCAGCSPRWHIRWGRFDRKGHHGPRCRVAPLAPPPWQAQRWGVSLPRSPPYRNPRWSRP